MLDRRGFYINYNPKEFVARANKKALMMWIIMSVVLTAAYIFEVLKGAKTLTYYLVMLVFTWGPIIPSVNKNLNGRMVNLDILQDKALQGVVIRSSNDNGNYIVGCRMPEDNELIRQYVNERM